MNSEAVTLEEIMVAARETGAPVRLRFIEDLEAVIRDETGMIVDVEHTQAVFEITIRKLSEQQIHEVF